MPFSWSDLAGIVTRPPQAQYADFSGLPDAVFKARQLADHEQAMAAQEEQAKAALLQKMAQAQASEMGRHERAMMRGQSAADKLAFERERLAQQQGTQQQELFRKAQADLENAVRMGDPQAIDIARQHLQQLGFEVSGGAATPSLAQPGSSSALTGRPELVPPPQAKAFAGPPATAGVPKPPVNTSALDAAAQSQGQPIHQGLPPQPPQTSPSPVNDQMNAAKQRTLPGAPPQAPPQPPPTPGIQPNSPQPIVVRKDAKELLRLGAPGVDQGRSDEYFKPLLEEAKTAEEKRAARIAQHTARVVTEREGIEKGREAGTRAYQFELNRLRKGGAGGGGSGAAPNFGGTGMSKSEYQVSEKDDQTARHIIDKTMQEGHITKLADSETAFQQMLGNLSAGSNLGNLGALKSFIKTTDDRISDADFRLAAGTGGAWNQLHQKLQYYLSLPDTTQMTPEFLAEIKNTANAGLGALTQRKKELAGRLSTRLAGAQDLSPKARERWSKSAPTEFGLDSEQPQQAAPNAGGQGSLYERLKLRGR